MDRGRLLTALLALLALFGGWSISVAGWTDVVNLISVNSRSYEESPAISATERTLYITSNRPLGSGYFDVWTARMTSGDTFSTPVNLGPTINGDDFDGVSYVTPRGDAIWISSIRPGGLGSRDIYTAQRIGGVWTTPMSVGEPINTPYDDSAPTLAADGNTLVFASDRPGGLGASDLYICYRTPTGWTQPENLQVVNSTSDDRHPGLTFDGSVLYFASRRTGGAGGYDIYVSHLKNGHYTAAVNLGPEVNTVYDDECPCFYFDCQNLIVASDRPGGVGHLDYWRFNWSSDVDVQLNLDQASVRRGDSLGYTVTLTNLTGTTQEFQLWTELFGDSVLTYPYGPEAISLSPNQTLSQHYTQYIDPTTEPGYFAFAARIGTYPDLSTDLANDWFRVR